MTPPIVGFPSHVAYHYLNDSAVDWVPARTIGPDQTLLPDGVIIVYDGGVLSPAEVREIVLADGELAGFEFVTADEAARRVTPLVARRITACLQACEAGTVAALENGSPVALRRLAAQPSASTTARCGGTRTTAAGVVRARPAAR